MEGKKITSWRDLTLMQLGSLLSHSAGNGGRRLYKEWFTLVENVRHEEALNRNQEKAAKKKWSGFKVNVTVVLLAYFFTFSAAVHKRFLYPEQALSLPELVREYHLDLLTQSPTKATANFEFYFGGMIPHRVADLDPIDMENQKYISRTHAECVEICWQRMLNYMKEKDAPAPGTRAGDAFAWLLEKNQHAYEKIEVYNEKSHQNYYLFDYSYECNMEAAYPRFLHQLDVWNPSCMKLWEQLQRGARRRLREISAILELAGWEENGHA